ncbi:unnamed protein product [Rotaria magnacalcarata]|uniref:Uncharacterized protein n=3 Tax=Rotaria magnacalcarata TaxID=392030 RepID=A0A815ZMH7_9BILA|nr:unnamed protein product [Rotaria magnacalcarata]CAF1585093.1 unnamed protein product [Rotaria magnacalcarata]CAF2018865.1 unnamed protein product [Rotaria magnacalcarata]CAF4006411.1 unnamed protein product [Rotaria magnacalcarata]
MPGLGCDTRIEKSSIDITDRVYDLRNRVAWLKNVEFCLFGDQTDRLTDTKTERYDTELFNNDLRKKLINRTNKTIVSQSGKNLTNVEAIEYLNDKRNQAMQQHNELLFIQRRLLDRLESLHSQSCSVPNINNQSFALSIKQIQDTNIVTRRIREKQDRLKNVKLINKTLNLCKQHLQCDLDLLRKELPNVHKDTGHKFHQRMLLKKEFTDIVAENKRRLKVYQQLLDETEAQGRQRRVIHEQAMASVSEQLEDQYQVQMMAVNEMANSFESRKFNGDNGSIKNLQQNKVTMMNNEEIVQVRCMYDQYYNIIMAGYPIDIANSEQLKIMNNDGSAKIIAMLTMTNRMMEEKEQLNQQINRMDKLLKLIEMSMNLKNDTRNKILNTMLEQRQNLESIYMNDTVEEQNRILRQMNDFILVLSKALCEHIGVQFLAEPSIDFITRLQYVFDVISKNVKPIVTQPAEENASFPK